MQDVNELERNRQSEQPEVGDNGLVMFPFYLLVDVSYSMADEIGILNQSLRDFQHEVSMKPVLADITKLGILEFSDHAREVVPLGDFSAVDLSRDLLTAKGSTSFAAAFRTLRSTIERDVAKMKAANQAAPTDEMFHYHRPAVYFLTDGFPNPGDPWRQEFEELKAIKAYPLFVPFGFRQADEAILNELVHPRDRSRLYMAREGANPATIIAEMTKVMLMSVVASSMSVTAGDPTLNLPSQAQVGSSLVVKGDLLF
jgi:uncharacterized protein YegL